jgi:hypothetical protein
MRKSRSLRVANEAAFFLDNFEAILLREGCSRSFVEQFAYELYDVVFTKLPAGAWTDQAKFVELDKFLPLHSVYKFTEGFVTGLYSANGDQVVLHWLGIENSGAEALQSISVA